MYYIKSTTKFYLSKHLLKILYFTRIFKNITFRNNLPKFTISQISPQNSPISSQFQSNLIKHSIPATLLECLQALVQKTFNKTSQKKISCQSWSAQGYVILSIYTHSTRYLKKLTSSKYYSRDYHDHRIENFIQQGI